MKVLTYAASASATAILFAGGHAPQVQKYQPKAEQPIKQSLVTVASEPKKPNPPKEPVLVKAAPKVVTVEAGDSLAKIAKTNNVTWQRLFDKNTKVKDPDLIYPGQKLTIPTKNEVLAHRPLPASTAVVASPSTSAAQPSRASSSASTSQIRQSQPAPAPAAPSGSAWDRLAACESGGNWSINTGNGFYGGLQFTLSSWRAVGGTGLPSNASRSEQIMRAQQLQARQGWGAWPVCSAKAGLR